MDDFPRLPLALLPTPIERLDRWRRPADLYVKRDDLTGAELSGNKIRKLEYSLAAARAAGATRVVTCGGAQSNHCRATAAAAARLGVETHLVLRGPAPEARQGNLLLDLLLGAQVTWLAPEAWERAGEIMAALAGPEGYVIPMGASDPIGSLGYRAAAAEIRAWEQEQGMRFAAIVHAHGSGGTAAGLLWGREAHGLTGEIISVDVCSTGDDPGPTRAWVEEILDRGRAELGLSKPDLSAWRPLAGYAGRGYGLSSPEEVELIAELARSTGLILDPVYTGKAFCALVDLAARGELPSGPLLFLHTGGLLGLFGSDLPANL